MMRSPNAAILNRRAMAGHMLAGLLVTGVLGACSPAWQDQAQRRHSHAFIDYWPPPKDDQALRLAVKDLIDMKGVVTTAGSEYLAKTRAPATRDAKCLEIARERKVRIVGKTNLTEFAVTVSGRNSYFGTPLNRRKGQPQLIPGGSSSGSAVAVASGMADVAFGTDTGGSIRVPAACCGIYGLKTTYGLVSTKGVFPISPKHLDTVGPMARDLPHLVLGMDLLQRDFAGRYAAAVAAKPAARQIRIGRLYLTHTDPGIDSAIDQALVTRGFKITRLGARFQAKWDQAETDGKTVALADAWLHDKKYADQNGVWSTTKLVILKGELDYNMGYKGALKRKAAWQRELSREFEKVDFIAVPTLQNLPPSVPYWGSSIVFEWMVFNSQNTVGVNFAGNPALAIPIQMPATGKKKAVTSLQLVGPRLSEAQLLNAGRLLAAKP
jgi:Asp-tRNA(Asn)/Glu-tRNA(Gln) amidotransferase A subunit family amidase